MKNLIAILSLTVLTFTTFSCKKDKEDPTIMVSTPEEHSNHKWGSTVHINATFEDDRGLKNYVVMVVDEAGNHSMAFDFMKSGDLSDVKYDFHEHFTVPANAPMMAWVQFTVTDEEDKSVTKKWMLHFEE